VHARLSRRAQISEASIVAELPAGSTAKLKSIALKGGATVCGVADAVAFDAHAPEKHRPGDLLPGARSVVVVGGAQPRGGHWAGTPRCARTPTGPTARTQG